MIGKIPQGLVIAVTLVLGLVFQPVGVAAKRSASAAAAPPSGFTVQTVVSGLSLPTSFTFAPDGRIFIAEKSGDVRVFKNGSLLPTPLIDISAIVNNFSDRGLIGMALDPNFASNGYIYLLYPYEATATDDSGTKTARLSRFTVVGDTAAPNTEKVLLGTNVGSACSQFPVGSDCIPAEWYGHGVGDIHFGADGTMFLTNGDASSWNSVNDDALRAQNLDSLAGKILRIDPATGQGLADNPYWNGDPNAARSKVWAYGVRNAYRFSVRPGSGSPGTVYAGDVGWNNTEEIDAVPKGANLGWPCYEGNTAQAGYQLKPVCLALYNAVAADPSKWTQAILTYEHNGVGAAVTGGPFYTGTTYPAQYQGAYFFGDYARNRIQYVTVNASNAVTWGPVDFDASADSPVDIQLGPDGNLYYLSIASGQVRTYVYGGAPPPPPPTGGYLSDLPWTSATNGWGPVERDMSNADLAAGDGHTITLNGVTYAKGLGTHAASDVRYALAGCTSFQSDVGIDDEVGANGTVDFQVYLDGTLTYDSGVMTGATATKSINLDLTGKSTLRLVATNGGDNINYDHADWAGARITCGSGNRPPVPIIASPTSSTTFAVGDVVNFQGSATDPEDGTLPASALSWQINIQHCIGASCHIHYFQTVAGSGGSFTVPDHGDMYHFDLTLTATDSAGLSTSTTVSIQPRTLNLTLATNPTGLQVVLGGTAGTAPYTTTQVDGATVTITTLSPQNGATFSSWSDGGAQQHNVTLGTADVTYTATFVGGGGGGSPPMFGPATTLAAGTNPHSVVAADVNGDGKPDLIDANALSNSVTVFKGSGDGTFLAGASFSVGTGTKPKTADVADLDKDGKPDIVTANQDSSTVSVLRGNGDGTFASPVQYATCAQAHEAAIGDLNGDGKLDLAVACWGGSVISVLLGNGNATFGSAVNYVAGANPHSIVISEFNGDGKPDLAVANRGSNNVSVLLGSGNGTFQSAVNYGVGSGPHSVRAGDLNGDGKIDLVTANDGSNNVTVLRGNGNGTFVASTYATGLVPESVAIGDVNGNGIPDVVTANTAGNGDGVTGNPGGDRVSVLLGDGTGALGTSTEFLVGQAPFSVYLADLNGDGKLDLSTADWNSNTVTVRLNAGSASAPPLVINSVSPADGTAGVPASWNVTATFSADVNQSTLTSSTFTLMQGASSVAAQLSYNAATRTVTLDPNANLQASATYTATVVGGASGVKDTSGNPLAASKTWTFTVAAAGATTSYLSDLTWTSMSNGWGPVEKDTSVGGQAAGDGKTITLNGVTYAKGLGAHAASDVRYALVGCTSFQSDVGVDDEVGSKGSVVFKVFLDGTKVYGSGKMTGSTATKSITLNTTGKSQLRLVVTNGGDDTNNDHADWAGARVTCSS